MNIFKSYKTLVTSIFLCLLLAACGTNEVDKSKSTSISGTESSDGDEGPDSESTEVELVAVPFPDVINYIVASNITKISTWDVGNEVFTEDTDIIQELFDILNTIVYYQAYEEPLNGSNFIHIYIDDELLYTIGNGVIEINFEGNGYSEKYAIRQEDGWKIIALEEKIRELNKEI